MNLPPYDIFPTIMSVKLTLREIRPADIRDIFEISFYNGKQAVNEDEAMEMLNKINIDYQKGNSIHWGIADKVSNVIMGTCGYYRGFADESGELGCVLRTEYRGKGIMIEAMKAAINFGLINIGLKRVTAITTKNNIRAVKLLERLKFEKISDSDDDKLEYTCLKQFS